MLYNPDDFLVGIHNAVEGAVRDAVEHNIQAAVAQYEKDLRKSIGQIVTSVLSEYSAEFDGRKLVITVNRPEQEQTND